MIACLLSTLTLGFGPMWQPDVGVFPCPVVPRDAEPRGMLLRACAIPWLYIDARPSSAVQVAPVADVEREYPIYRFPVQAGDCTTSAVEVDGLTSESRSCWSVDGDLTAIETEREYRFEDVTVRGVSDATIWNAGCQAFVRVFGGEVDARTGCPTQRALAEGVCESGALASMRLQAPYAGSQSFVRTFEPDGASFVDSDGISRCEYRVRRGVLRSVRCDVETGPNVQIRVRRNDARWLVIARVRVESGSLRSAMRFDLSDGRVVRQTSDVGGPDERQWAFQYLDDP